MFNAVLKWFIPIIKQRRFLLVHLQITISYDKSFEWSLQSLKHQHNNSLHENKTIIILVKYKYVSTNRLFLNIDSRIHNNTRELILFSLLLRDVNNIIIISAKINPMICLFSILRGAKISWFYNEVHDFFFFCEHFFWFK